MPVTRCPICGVITRKKLHCKPPPRLQTHCTDCGALSRDPNHCTGKPRCANPKCDKAGRFPKTIVAPPGCPTVGLVVCGECISFDPAPDVVWENDPRITTEVESNEIGEYLKAIHIDGKLVWTERWAAWRIDTKRQRAEREKELKKMEVVPEVRSPWWER